MWRRRFGWLAGRGALRMVVAALVCEFMLVATGAAQRRLPAVEVEPGPSDRSEVFAPPALGGPTVSPTCGEQPRFVGPPSTEAWCAQSYYLPSLGRYGLVAPVTPGIESPRSLFQRCPPQRPSFCPPPVAPGAAIPPVDEEALHAPPCTGAGTYLAPSFGTDFTADPFYDRLPYDVCAEQGIYGDKQPVPVQRPLVELGLPFYQNGPIPPPGDLLGITNPTQPKFYIYGDYRAAVAHNQVGTDKGFLAHRLNLEWDLWFTATERLHMFTGPFQRGGDFMRLELQDGRVDYQEELEFWNDDTDTFFFEGDLGYILGGLNGNYAAFDLPFAVGMIPLLLQNGVWMEDAFLGAAVTIPARNSPRLDWSNFDITFFAGFEQVTTPAFGNINTGANMIGATTFIESRGGYFEIGYAFLDDPTASGRSYHNLGVSYTRRYLNAVSNSVRVILNGGQNGPRSARTAHGALVIIENSFLTPMPYNVIPYINLFVGFDSPQSAARAGAAGGVLRNTGILFESDNLTGYPTLDATANDTYGAAVGLDLLPPDFSQQLLVEAALVMVHGSDPGRNARGDQFGVGLRYQLPLTNAHLLRLDAMHGWLDQSRNVTGARIEYRWKF